MKQIIFECSTCVYRNKMELGMPGFEPLTTEFDSLTDAFNHLMENPDDIHHLIAKVDEAPMVERHTHET
jgi:hypothetical protein